ncbi:MAG: 1-deoxy-D-xylulose-5-phosphate reductoisomerase [Acidobacteria bacterium]|nr:MAG: 1-deoxy-D-xylulose-5-phosphate reductoisomerase [Acidobacteriota bacterium]
MKALAILGSTGSIGRQTLQVVESLQERFRVVALAAGGNLEELAGQIARHRPQLVSVSDAGKAAELRERLRQAANEPRALPDIQHGREGLLSVATHPDAAVVVSAAVGVVGLEATYAAVQAGKRVALSNKEVLVAAGELVMAAAKAKGVELLPVDSEHNAIHQCLRAGRSCEVRRLILTASGGPFRRTPMAQMAQATPEQALAHPNWRMGRRITIDSATLVNKGFEVIEAHWLFGIDPKRIDVVIHPQSTIHSMVEYVDGSILAQLGPTDMRMPIRYALTYPDREGANGVELNWDALRRLDFEKVPPRKFPCLHLARRALEEGGAQTCALNAADEVAVEAFLERRLPFSGIARVIERVLDGMPKVELGSIDDVLAADGEARRLARLEIETGAELAAKASVGDSEIVS